MVMAGGVQDDAGVVGVDGKLAVAAVDQPPFPRPPARTNGSFRGLPQKANS